MLAAQQGRRTDQNHLLAGHGGGKGRPQCHFGLAETDIATDQPVHWLARSQVLQRLLDGAGLVVGLVIGETGAEFLEETVRRRDLLAEAQFAMGGALKDRKSTRMNSRP